MSFVASRAANLVLFFGPSFHEISFRFVVVFTFFFSFFPSLEYVVQRQRTRLKLEAFQVSNERLATIALYPQRCLIYFNNETRDDSGEKERKREKERERERGRVLRGGLDGMPPTPACIVGGQVQQPRDAFVSLSSSFGPSCVQASHGRR